MSRKHATTPTRLALGLAALGMLGWLPAQACSLTAWDPNPTGSPATGGRTDDPAVGSYAGLCGMAPVVGTDPSFVTESTNHTNEGVTAPLRVRFFIFPGLTAGTPTVFRATDADNGAGNAVVEVAYDAANQAFDFTVNGADAGSTAAASAPRNRWSRVEFTYQAGQAFAASTRNVTASSSLSNPPTVAGDAPGVESVQLGIVVPNGAQGQPFFDEYEGSRSATGGATVFTTRIRGDASGDGNCNVGDITSIARDLLFQDLGAGENRAIAPGQPDCDENGNVNVGDITCFARRLIDFDLNDTPCD